MSAAIARKTQAGASLLIAMVMLVSLSLAGVALMRSVDVGNVLTGNLAFKQAALHANDSAVQVASYMITGLGTPDTARMAGFRPPVLTAAQREANRADVNYRAAMFARSVEDTANPDGIGADGVPNLLRNAPFPSGPGEPAGYGGAPGVSDSAVWADRSTGFTVRWVLERLCRVVGPATAENCSITESSEVTAGTVNERYAPGTAGVYYRLTVRVDGPRNTVTYTQVILKDS